MCLIVVLNFIMYVISLVNVQQSNQPYLAADGNPSFCSEP